VTDVIVVGAGLAGLSCARELRSHGMDVLVLERSDAPGGRVRTDEADGFLLDRGFQVLLSAYPEARHVLDFERLGLRPFYSGALVRNDRGFARVADPFRHPLDAARSVRSGPGSLADKARVARLRRRLSTHSLNEVLSAPQVTTREALKREGFSSALVDGFFRPFLGGIFLDPALDTSSRMFAFVFKLFAEGEAVLPAAGMEAIPRQLAEGLPAAALRLGTTVESVTDGAVTLAGGERLEAAAVVVAADGPEAARLTGALRAPAGRAATCVYFAAEHSPLGEPVLVLNGAGRGDGPVNDLCVPSDVAPSYAPAGAALVSATVLGIPEQDDDALEAAVRQQVRRWFGAQVDGWRRLAVYRIPYALPALTPAEFAAPERPVRLRPGLFVCGDHRDSASIQGALSSGRRAAAAVRGVDSGPACAL
jgi:phytoene dehydrogenase-like protein